jgi:hypothetical protein
MYATLKDGADTIAEIERVCTWLMDPVLCPTDWPLLLNIRNNNPLYAQTGIPAVGR